MNCGPLRRIGPGVAWPTLTPARPARSSPRSAAARAGRAQALPVRPVPGRCAGDGRARPPVRPRQSGRAPVIFRIWPDYTLEPQIDRSAPTVKADAAWRSYDARGRGIVWAVIDSGIDACHPHFSALELAAEGRGDSPAAGPDESAAPRFQLPGQPERPGAADRPAAPGAPLGAGPVRRERARHPRRRHHRRPVIPTAPSAGRGFQGSDGRRLCPAGPRRPAVRHGAGL